MINVAIKTSKEAQIITEALEEYAHSLSETAEDERFNGYDAIADDVEKSVDTAQHLAKVFRSMMPRLSRVERKSARK